MAQRAGAKNYFQYLARLTAVRNSFPIFEQIYKALSKTG